MPFTLLPNELQQTIFLEHFGPCLFLRRHTCKINIRYSSHAHDSHIRSTAPLDTRERHYYAARRRALQLLSRTCALHGLIAERDWLRTQQPVDYRTFAPFCDEPSAVQYQNPPVFNDTERQHLAQRASLPLPAFGLHLVTLDQRIHEGLLKLWSAEIPALPAQVRKLQVIAKLATVSAVGPGFPSYMTDPLAPVSQALNALEAKGRVVYRGMLLAGAAIRE
ncbi:hypothetical protein B0A55_02525 [Friedmanniomyces simplex]|uniref:Uncharacterized protein n=1 Tax=Friedmanniomyces simplex TaxID=329884 RepID=A0A4U0XTM4_9PEZI|nr:hypothetical protein B0A55_02525 [Friedmanniomyces simplex]